MRKHNLIGIASAVTLAAGVTTWARQRDERPPNVVATSRVTDFVKADDGYLVQRSRINHVCFVFKGETEVYLDPEEDEVVAAVDPGSVRPGVTRGYLA